MEITIGRTMGGPDLKSLMNYEVKISGGPANNVNLGSSWQVYKNVV